jgi:metal-responsive CopG/Arc/MetJ family transcriptional regulator
VPNALSKRTHVILPVDVLTAIDKLVGKRGRSAFIAQVASEEILRRQQRNALKAAKGAWKDVDHPALKAGAAAWVRQMRAESEKRFESIKKNRTRS